METIYFTNKKSFNDAVENVKRICPKHKIKQTNSSITWDSFLYSKKSEEYIIMYSLMYFERKKIKGLHLIPLFETNVWKQITEGLYCLEKGYATQRLKLNKQFSVFSINENLEKLKQGSKIYEVDMNACYWAMAYKLGMIDKKLFNYASKKKEWKKAKLVAIGNMYSVVKHKDIIFKEEQVYLEGEYYTTMKTLRPLWVRIVDEVMRMSLEIADEYKEDVLFFLTDAFFVRTKGARDKIYQKLYTLGFLSKKREHIVNEININSSIYLQWKKDTYIGLNFALANDIEYIKEEFAFVEELIKK